MYFIAFLCVRFLYSLTMSPGRGQSRNKVNPALSPTPDSSAHDMELDDDSANKEKYEREIPILGRPQGEESMAHYVCKTVSIFCKIQI